MELGLRLIAGLIGAISNGGRTNGGRIRLLGTLLAVFAVLLIPAGFSAIDPLVLGELLVAAGLIGAIAVAHGGRTRRLGTLLAVIAVLAILLGGAIALRRRAERSRLFSRPALRTDGKAVIPPAPPPVSRRRGSSIFNVW